MMFMQKVVEIYYASAPIGRRH